MYNIYIYANNGFLMSHAKRVGLSEYRPHQCTDNEFNLYSEWRRWGVYVCVSIHHHISNNISYIYHISIIYNIISYIIHRYII